MKKFVLAITFLSMACALYGAENLMKNAAYQVFPGDWNKNLVNDSNLGRHIDPDFDRASGKRKGLLADGKVFQRAVCFNYHWTKKEQRFVTVVVDLGKEYAVEKVFLGITRNNEAYTPGKYTVETSTDNMVFSPFGGSDQWQGKRYERTAEVTAAAKKCRYVRVKVWTISTWINLTEIGVYGK